MRVNDLLYCTGFALVELVAAVEVTAMIVAAPAIAGALGIPETGASWILNSYLYPVFATLLILLIRSGEWVSRLFSPRGIFVTGLALFIAGNLISGFSSIPSHFFAGRIVQAVGGALAYLGQLWTAMIYFRERLVTVMFWGECGLAVGIISGPMIGGYLAAWGESGWRTIFLLNAFFALAAVGMGLAGLRAAKTETAAAPGEKTSRPVGDSKEIYWLLGLQWAVMLAVVGGEYLLSNEFQLRRGLSSQYVGWVTAAASAGAVAGSGLVAARPDLLSRWLRFGSAAVVSGMSVLGICLAYWPHLWSLPVLFVLGAGMGTVSVSIYARIAERAPADAFVRVSILYLLAQQLGNGMGIQLEEIMTAVLAHPLLPALFLACPTMLLGLLAQQRPTRQLSVKG